MKKELFPSILLSVVCLITVCVIYPAIVWAVAQVAPNRGEGFVINEHNKKYYKNIGQKFTDDKYFWSRPSAVDYNAAGSGGSNKGPDNRDYLATVQQRIDTFLARNPGVKKSDIPSDIVTASGSGLDPDISVQAANIQVRRIANIRKVSEQIIRQLIQKDTERPLAGLFGPERVNVLKLNLDLNKLKK